MIGIEINVAQLARLREAVGKLNKNMGKEIAAAINATAKKTRLEMGKDIRSLVAMKKVTAEAPLGIVRPASRDSFSSTVRLKKTNRLPLKEFAARQDKKGVSYKIGKGGGRKRVNGAFEWKKIGHMFIREGNARLPIFKLHAVSSWGVFEKNNMTQPQMAETEAELYKQIERRINLNVLRASGLVKR